MNGLSRLPAALLVLTIASNADAFCSYFNFTISPSQVVPPANGSGFGGGEIFLCDDDRLTGSVSVNTTDAVTAVHVHGPAGAGATGDLLFTLPLPIGSHVVVDLGPLTAEARLLVDSEQTYVDVHSVEHPDGVLRGQLRHEVAVAPVNWGTVKSLYQR